MFDRLTGDGGLVDGELQKLMDQARQAEELAGRVADLEITAVSADGAVEVTVAASGAMTNLVLHDEVGSRPPYEIAEAVLDTMRIAQGRLAGRVAELTEDTVGSDTETGRAIVESYADRYPDRETRSGYDDTPPSYGTNGSSYGTNGWGGSGRGW